MLGKSPHIYMHVCMCVIIYTIIIVIYKRNEIISISVLYFGYRYFSMCHIPKRNIFYFVYGNW